MTCRDEILACIRRLNKSEFTVIEIIDAMKYSGTRFPEATILTEITCRLCSNAPKHHAKTYDDLERVDRGIYRLKSAMQAQLNTPKPRLPFLKKRVKPQASGSKSPWDRPDFWKQETGPCPTCGYPIVVARKSRKTGELYFGCARPKRGPHSGCNFKGCRSH